MKKLVALAGLLVLGGSLGVILASCGSDSASSPGSPPQQTNTNPNPVLNPDGSSPAQLGGDGRYFGYVRTVDAKAQPPSISFDVAQFFFGKSVQKAAEEDGAVAPGEPVSNDHYERNREKAISVLELAPGVEVAAAPPASYLMWHLSREARRKCDPSNEASCTLSLKAFFAAVNEIDARYGIPVWVTIRDDVVVRIDEQYFP